MSLDIYYENTEKLSDYNVLVTVNRQTGVEMYYFIKKFRKVEVWGGSVFGGNISSAQITMNCDHVVEKTDKTFKIIKCRTSQHGSVVLRLMAEYIESI